MQETTLVKLDFKPFKQALAAQFERMKTQPLFRTDVSKDWLWQTYINSFPEGSNPIFKERTEHDCNCCKSFVRAVGNVVAIVDGALVSIWDIQIGGAYQVVADAMAEMVKSNPIVNVFLHSERTAGVDKNFQQIVGEAQKTWDHFFVNIPPQYVSDDIGAALNGPRTTQGVMLRGLTEITTEAIQTVLDLIAQNSLYRGEESKFALTSFQALKTQFDVLRSDQAREIFVWSRLKHVPESVAKIRGTALGTLLLDLSNGVDLEKAVGSFEAIMAPTNYRRPTALITPQMVASAKAKIEELGLMSALERRYATITDITVPNTLFANRSAKAAMNRDVFDDLAAGLPEKVKNFDKVEEVTIDKFVSDILPTAQSVEVLFENSHIANLVSLVAPVDPTAGQLLKWGNNFSWDYNGGLADSIKERVKQAGGNVTGDLCCRLSWSNYDDLDLHMVEVNNSYTISFQNRGQMSRSGGTLDVDMNAGGGHTRTPVENIVYKNRNTIKDGVYRLVVSQFRQRERDNVGFEVEFDFMGKVHTFVYDKAVRDKENILVVEFKYTKAGGVEILNSLPSTESTKTVWNLPTQAFHKVNVLMMSPNHWDGQGVGNRHYFFMIDGCRNEGVARGFFNEFLNPALDPHRKAFETVGSKMKTEESNNQLSGLGFSSTQRNHLVCRVKGSFTRVIKIVF